MSFWPSAIAMSLAFAGAILFSVMFVYKLPERYWRK